jgi:predicted aspartyl protease
MLLSQSCNSRWRTARRRLVLLALMAGGAAACTETGLPAASSAPGDTTGGGVAFRLAGPGGAALVVPAYVNGRGPVDLILDTGATLTCLDTSLVRELALPERRAVLGAAVGVRGAGRVRLVRIDSLRVGTASAQRLTGCALDLRALHALAPGLRGLLGLNFLRSFRVTLDFEREVLHLTQPGK